MSNRLSAIRRPNWHLPNIRGLLRHAGRLRSLLHALATACLLAAPFVVLAALCAYLLAHQVEANISIRPSGTSLRPGQVASFSATDHCAQLGLVAVSHHWRFSGAAPAEASGRQISSVQFFRPGTQRVQLTVTCTFANGSDLFVTNRAELSVEVK